MKKYFINFYPDNISFFSCLSGEARFIKKSILFFVANKFRCKRILTYPFLAESNSILSKIADSTNYIITNNTKKKYDFAFWWDNATIRNIPEELKIVNKKFAVQNFRSNNTMKSFIDDFFYEVFGYKTRIDPTLYKGKAICRNEFSSNCKAIQCPTAAKNNYIYQTLINNKNEDGLYEEMVVIIVDGKIPAIYINLKTAESRFKSSSEKVCLRAVAECLSIDEQLKILRFAEIIGLDFGEVKTLRDHDNRKLYIIDVNNTAFCFPRNITKPDCKKLINSLSTYFITRFRKSK